MAAARIAAILLAASVSVLSAQQEATTRLTICVSDATRAQIPNAWIEIGAPLEDDPIALANLASALAAGQDGCAVFNLPKGSYTVRVSAPLFKGWAKHVDLAGGSTQTVDATLQLARIGRGDPIVIAEIRPLVCVETSPLPLIPLDEFKVMRLAAKRAR